MIFSSLEYLIFLPLVVLLFWQLKGAARTALLVVSSFFFYMSWLPAYGILLLILSAANWALGLAIDRVRQSSSTSKALLAAGLVLNLGCLCYYKYTNFFLENIVATINSISHTALGFGLKIPAYEVPILDVLLPLGISFFVFEFIHYLVDVFKGSKPLSSLMEFLAFAAFFPSQIAGPIKRFQEFAENIRAPQKMDLPLFNEATGLIVQGLFKKVAIADPIGALVYPVYASTTLVSSSDALIAAIGFVVQVYCDFSGYTDIGRGSALLMGIRLPENFQLPYLAADLAAFWRRWHISLSSWLRDYIYIPLGGSKHGLLNNWRNLFLTMLACGLWHGANWHYVIFGCLQGVGLVVQKEWSELCKRVPALSAFGKSSLAHWLGVFGTMLFITATFVVFRAPDMPAAGRIFASMVNFTGACELYSPLLKSGVLVFLPLYFACWQIRERGAAFLENSRIWQSSRVFFEMPMRLAVLTASALIMLAATPQEAVPFVYFQF
ncbi:MAG: hypothetical protein K2X77_08380 [Candidatus Obscuribacterales bacterium]|jgi:D-alanyl-lipoteichoic acid acyltransferase DltB (MBOAT superfamily)|nr:hypothetical protein [Candidatus Obscuribacterales bacterium]